MLINGRVHTLFKKLYQLESIGVLGLYRNYIKTSNYTHDFVKKTHTKTEKICLVLQKRLSCNAKQALLPCNIGSFTTQNNGYYKALLYSWLRNIYSLEKSLQFFYHFPTLITR